jgi:hypothetical protein
MPKADSTMRKAIKRMRRNIRNVESSSLAVNERPHGYLRKGQKMSAPSAEQSRVACLVVVDVLKIKVMASKTSKFVAYHNRSVVRWYKGNECEALARSGAIVAESRT